MVFSRLVLDEVKRLLNVTHNNTSSHCIETHDKVGQFLQEKNTKTETTTFKWLYQRFSESYFGK